MVCRTVELRPGVRAIVCSSRRRPRRCTGPGPRGQGCALPEVKLCDWPVGQGKTCDKPLCALCAVSGGPDVDYCPAHAKETA